MRLIYLTQTKETRLTEVIKKLIAVLATHGELRVRLAMQPPAGNTDGVRTHDMVSTE
jgi:hypothetical protein